MQGGREELHPNGFELVTVGLDTLGAAGCRAFIEAAVPQHPSLIDQHHILAKLFGVINIPSALWIDEQGVIVRPAETAPAPPVDGAAPGLELPDELPPHFVEMMAEAANISADPEAYHSALRDWVAKGDDSQYALSYYPSNQRWDGNWRTVEVRLPGNPSYRVQARPGYYGVTPDRR